LAVEIMRRRRFALLLGLRLYRPRDGFVEEGPNCFVAGQRPVFDKRPIERNNGADRRHCVRRVVEWLHFHAFPMDCAAASLVTAIKAGCVVAVRNLLNGLQSLGDRGAKLPCWLGNAYVVAGTHGRASVVAKQQLAEEFGCEPSCP